MACFFIGEDCDTAVRIWDGSGWNGLLGLRKLQNRCLMEVDSENRIRMHNDLRDLGRDIGEKEPPHRLWLSTDSLLHNLFDKLSVRGIGMVQKHGSEWPDPQSFKSLAALPDSRLLTNMSRLQVLKASGNCVESIFSIVHSPQLVCLSPQLVWLCWHSCPFTSLPSWIPLNKLRVLEIKGIELETLWPDEHQAPLLLRELIVDAPLSKIPESIGHLKNLEKLVLHQNERVEEINLKTFLDELCHLKSLKCLVLRKCPNLKLLPDSFVNLTNLEYIDLSGCFNLQKLPKCFWKLQNLQHIDLSGCMNSTTLPPGLWKSKKPPEIE
uniref:Disease resistance protein Roq1-like winged-helix domain-containing protein n=1 Tax=Picea sitchensis TaxID=3332 RepID=D5ADI3_PICSI|nr:unknown [Picea sitchensis]